MRQGATQGEQQVRQGAGAGRAAAAVSPATGAVMGAQRSRERVGMRWEKASEHTIAAGHPSLVRRMPLWLYNFETRELHGIFKAASDGGHTSWQWGSVAGVWLLACQGPPAKALGKAGGAVVQTAPLIGCMQGSGRSTPWVGRTAAAAHPTPARCAADAVGTRGAVPPGRGSERSHADACKCPGPPLASARSGGNLKAPVLPPPPPQPPPPPHTSPCCRCPSSLTWSAPPSGWTSCAPSWRRTTSATPTSSRCAGRCVCSSACLVLLV